jgi:transcriptional regulator with XRE-family HTH domain
MWEGEGSRVPLEDRLEALGARVRALRLRLGLTQEQLGHRVGMSHGHVSEIETGRTNITMATLWRLADALGVQAAELLDEPASAG